MSHREYYDGEMAKIQKTCPEQYKKQALGRIIWEARRDPKLRPLTLCAFLQDHAAFIKEYLK